MHMYMHAQGTDERQISSTSSVMQGGWLLHDGAKPPFVDFNCPEIRDLPMSLNILGATSRPVDWCKCGL